MLAWRFLLSRYPYLWDDHQTFSGVTYVEANYLLPGIVGRGRAGLGGNHYPG